MSNVWGIPRTSYSYKCPTCGQPFMSEDRELSSREECTSCKVRKWRVAVQQEMRETWWDQHGSLRGATLEEVYLDNMDVKRLYLRDKDRQLWQVYMDYPYMPDDETAILCFLRVNEIGEE